MNNKKNSTNLSMYFTESMKAFVDFSRLTFFQLLIICTFLQRILEMCEYFRSQEF